MKPAYCEVCQVQLKRGTRGRAPRWCEQHRKEYGGPIRREYSRRYREAEREQLIFLREFVTLMAAAQAEGHLEMWLAPVDLQATARRWAGKPL